MEDQLDPRACKGHRAYKDHRDSKALAGSQEPLQLSQVQLEPLVCLALQPTLVPQAPQVHWEDPLARLDPLVTQVPQALVQQDQLAASPAATYASAATI